jgi:hypothetical protein
MTRWIQAYRIRRGLLWRRSYPPVPWREIGYLLAIFVLWSLAMTRDYADEQRQVAITQEARAERMTAEVGLCMEGRAVWLSADKKTAIKCRPAEEFPI